MYEAVVIGVSAGGMAALKTLLPRLPASFPMSVAIVQHVAEEGGSFLPVYLDGMSAITVKEAEEKEPMLAGTAYLAPAGYHLLIEPDHTFSLSADPRVNFSCPSIDVLFESAADAFGEGLVGVILTGANGDGSRGLQAVKAGGGLTIVQDPASAQSAYMPRAAIAAVRPDHIADLGTIARLLVELGTTSIGEDAHVA